jgi:hypothetical protein
MRLDVEAGQRFVKIVDTPYNGSFFGVDQWMAAKLVTYGLRGNAFVSDDVGKVRGVGSKAGTDANLVGAGRAW